ncbi:MAG TPA: 5-(carboxyamino)imidazole ribonucleotide synthase [Gemmatimonadales bacterium]|nr:5-(carboxyamino)imidazole ribonucleotide synthase [Gemmatimonadales bacterium]
MILPGATLGMLGGGQLGRMFAFRAHEMGYRVVVLEPDPRSPAGAVADEHIVARYDDEAALRELASKAAVVTTEFENVPAPTLALLETLIRVTPPPSAVAVAQDRVAEKTHLQNAGFLTAAFAPVGSSSEAGSAARRLGGRCILKTARLGYDGKGQTMVSTPDEAAEAYSAMSGVPCILEEKLTLERELSVVLARGGDGDTAVFPVGENVHRGGILHSTMVPAGIDQELTNEARGLARRVAESLAYVGVLGVELFVANGGQLYVNEIAPRPHNSGHYTIDACATDQFEQQVRAACGLPLGDTRLVAPVAMINLLGDLWADGEPAWDRALAEPGLRLHLYGKAEPRPGRKMGHLTVLAATPAEALAIAERAFAALGGRP